MTNGFSPRFLGRVSPWEASSLSGLRSLSWLTYRTTLHVHTVSGGVLAPGAYPAGVQGGWVYLWVYQEGVYREVYTRVYSPVYPREPGRLFAQSYQWSSIGSLGGSRAELSTFLLGSLGSSMRRVIISSKEPGRLSAQSLL